MRPAISTTRRRVIETADERMRPMMQVALARERLEPVFTSSWSSPKGGDESDSTDRSLSVAGGRYLLNVGLR